MEEIDFSCDILGLDIKKHTFRDKILYYFAKFFIDDILLDGYEK